MCEVCLQRHIDDILTLIEKGDKWEALTMSLNDKLNEVWDSKAQEAIKDAIQYVDSLNRDLTEKDFDSALEIISVYLGEDFSDSIKADLRKIQVKTYKTAFKDIGVEFSFNKSSKDALNWLNNFENYFLKNHYEDNVRGKIKTACIEASNEGLSRELMGNRFRDILSVNLIPESYTGGIRNYFEGVANNAITRAREFGRVDAYVRADIKYLKVVAVVDTRTSTICREMNGKIIPVSNAVKLRDAYMKCEPQDVKDKFSWLNQKQVEDKIVGKNGTEINYKYSLPPYHFKCRTMTVAATDDEIKALE